MHHHAHGVSTLGVLVPEGTQLSAEAAAGLLTEDFEPEAEEWVEVANFGDSEIGSFPPLLCQKCDSPVNAHGYCPDDPCVYSDWPQVVSLDDVHCLTRSELEAKYGITKRDRAPG